MNFWEYKIFNNSKILHYAIIKNKLTGISLQIPYSDLSHMDSKAAEDIIKNITKTLNI